MSMNEEEFASFLWALENTGLAWAVDDLRARDTAQREALARVEAERDEAREFMRINARSGMHYAEQRDQYRDLYQASIGFADRYKVERDTAQAQLAEAVGLLKALTEHAYYEEEFLEADVKAEAFLARHAPAEQQEAQGAQTGDERAAFESAWSKRLDLSRDKLSGCYYSQATEWRWEGWQARAALATQPAVQSQASEFQREDRYMVIKRKDLEKAHVTDREWFKNALSLLELYLPKREYLVIESDWPEYEPTWAAIQARVEGRATQPAEQWIACSDRLPEVSEGCQQEFIVCAKRNQSGKLAVMSALYLNAYPLYCEYDNDEADEDGNIPHTGWYDAKSNGDDANCYSEMDDSRYAYGAKVTHWMPLPQPAAVRGAEHE